MENTFSATSLTVANAYVLGCALDYFPFQSFKRRVRILFVLFSILSYWEIGKKEAEILSFYWSVSFGDG